MKVSGEFVVEMKPLDPHIKGGHGINMGRMALDKTYHGDLAAGAVGEMLSVMTATQGSAAYVAIEQVKGTLSGKNGSFVLQHFGVMNRGGNRLILEVVPDSGTDQLVGLSGEMNIIIENGKHYYEFEYEIKA